MKWKEVSAYGVIDKDGWIKLTPLQPDRLAMALRIYSEHGIHAKGEPYGDADDLRAANGTVAEAQFADHYGLLWTGGVTVEDPRSVIADVGTDIQVYTSGRVEGRLIVHRDELIKGQRWVHLAGLAPEVWFVGWIGEWRMREMWDQMDEDPRRTGGRVFPTSALSSPETFDGR